MAHEEQREYGEDAYWIRRHDRKRKRAEDVTDEWLLSWAALRPLLADSPVQRGGGATVLDLGCGTSPLALDLLRDHDATRIVGVDIAPGAIDHQLREQRSREAKGEAGASRASFAVVDVTRPDALRGASYDACIDKSTTDGLLCDTKRARSQGGHNTASCRARVARVSTLRACCRVSCVGCALTMDGGRLVSQAVPIVCAACMPMLEPR